MKRPVIQASIHDTTGVTLFSMMLGREAQILEYLVFGLPVGDAHVPQGGGGGGGGTRI